MNFFFITDDPDIAQFACLQGVDWIMVDLEILGKAERQGHLDTVQSAHNLKDVIRIRPVVPHGSLVVRTNPLNASSPAEVEDIVRAGADMVMLPYYHDYDEAAEFVRIVDDRVPVILLAETRGAMHSLKDCCSIPNVTRVHIGLNDLSLELGRRFMFELLIDGTVSSMAANLRSAGMPFGIGGIARVGEGLLPAERILIEHARMGSDAAILSRTFHRQVASVREMRATIDFAYEVSRLREVYDNAHLLPETTVAENSAAIASAIRQITAEMPDRRSVRSS